MKRWLRCNREALLVSLGLTLVFCYPWLFRDAIYEAQDTMFHLTRLGSLSQALQQHDFLPAVYGEENYAFGYGSPLFYNDLLLVPFAALHAAGLPLVTAFKLYLGMCCYVGCYWMHRFLSRLVPDSHGAVLISLCAYTFANYRITDFYIRNALGEVSAMAFLPLVLLGLLEILNGETRPGEGHLCGGLTGILLSHNLSFLMTAVLLVLFVLVSLKRMHRAQWQALCKAALKAFLLTCWFTLPMLEQLASQDFYLQQTTGNALRPHAMYLIQYLANVTSFGGSGDDYAAEERMLVNPGYFAMLAPLTLLVKREKKENTYFAWRCFGLGYACLVMAGRIIPWDSTLLEPLSLIQFPWRLMTLALPLLIAAACAGLSRLQISARRSFCVLLCVLLCGEGIWHLSPCLEREDTYSVLLDSSLSDEEAHDKIMRIREYVEETLYGQVLMKFDEVQLAGGEYLPLMHTDFRSHSRAIQNENHEDLALVYEKYGTTLSFTISQEGEQTLILPLIWYKGYVVTCSGKTYTTWQDPDTGLVVFACDGPGTYVCQYRSTPLRRACIAVSALTLLVLAVLGRKRKRRAEALSAD